MKSLSLSVENYSLICFANWPNIFQNLKRNTVSPRGHVISSTSVSRCRLIIVTFQMLDARLAFMRQSGQLVAE